MPDFNGLTEVTVFAPTDEIFIVDKSGTPISKRIAMSNLSSAGMENTSTMYSNTISTSAPVLNTVYKIDTYDFEIGIGDAANGQITIATTGIYRVSFSAVPNNTARNGKVFFRIGATDFHMGNYGRYGNGDTVAKQYMEVFTQSFSLTAGDVVSMATSIGSTFTIDISKATFQLEKY